MKMEGKGTLSTQDIDLNGCINCQELQWLINDLYVTTAPSPSYSYINVIFLHSTSQGIGNGIPLGAVVTTPQIASVLTRRNYFNTFGGNPVCTSAGHAVLRVIEKEKLQENALRVGTYLKERLTALKDKYECRFMHPQPQEQRSIRQYFLQVS